MNLLRNGLLMRKTGDLRRTELTEESASQCGFSAEFITPSRHHDRGVNISERIFGGQQSPPPRRATPPWPGLGYLSPFPAPQYRYGRERRVLSCPWHGWGFEIESGQALFDPAMRGQVYEVGARTAKSA